jgi:molybdopterin converting factor small subunit
VARVRIRVPAALRDYWGGGAVVVVEVATLAEALVALGPLASRVLDDQGEVRRHVQVFVNQVSTRDTRATLRDGDTIHILPAVSGGIA